MTSPTPLTRPSKEDIACLPVFEGLPLERIHLLDSESHVQLARHALGEARVIGFDTESKPTFTSDTVSDGPHVIQFATLEEAFIVQIGPSMPAAFLRDVIESEQIVKIGFGLASDRTPLSRKLDIRLGASIDLSQVIRALGYRQAVGIKAAVAIILKRRLMKSKSVTTSNWAARRLSASQLLYAANDAYAALAVFHALKGSGLLERSRIAIQAQQTAL